jgi:hypothetical protein
MRKVATFEHLENLARKKKSVICPGSRCWGRRSSPAAFMMQLSAEILHRLFRSGMFVYYSAKKKRVKRIATLPW